MPIGSLAQNRNLLAKPEGADLPPPGPTLAIVQPRASEPSMLATKELNRLGQSLWLDDITRALLDTGTLAKYIEEWSVTGLTSNPSIFDHAITHSDAYDDEISRLLDQGRRGEDLFFEIAIEDLVRAADMFLGVHQRTGTVDGWVSLEVSPLLAHDTKATVASGRGAARHGVTPQPVHQNPRHARRACRRSRKRSSPACRSTSRCCSPPRSMWPRPTPICAAWNGASRPGCPPDVRSVASVFVCRWDRGVADKVPADAAEPPWPGHREGRPIKPIAICSTATAGSAWPITAPSRNACCLPAPAPRTRRRPTRSMSPASPPRTR